MSRDEILNKISLRKHGIYFNQIPSIADRANILQEALDEVLQRKMIITAKGTKGRVCPYCRSIVVPITNEDILNALKEKS